MGREVGEEARGQVAWEAWVEEFLEGLAPWVAVGERVEGRVAREYKREGGGHRMMWLFINVLNYKMMIMILMMMMTKHVRPGAALGGNGFTWKLQLNRCLSLTPLAIRGCGLARAAARSRHPPIFIFLI